MQFQRSYIAPHDMKKQWYVIDAQNQVLGRLAVTIATILMGKHRPQYTPFLDTGDFVIITNIDKVKITGTKSQRKIYYWWTGYPGGLRQNTYSELKKRHPEEPLYLAVRRMLPKTRLGRQMLKKLKVYVGPNHPHAAQCPTVWQNPS